MLPSVKEETVERAYGSEKSCDRKKRDLELWSAGDCGDEYCGGEEQADRNFFREAAIGCRPCVNE
jgi:hypothetical protein